MQNIIDKTADFVESKLENGEGAHDWFHIERVWNNAKAICKEEEKADMFVVELAALLHDIADYKFHDGDIEAGPKAAREWLETLNVDNSVIEHVCEIIRHLSFKGAGAENPMQTIEGKIVRDADRLDALGAIGIARSFAYGGAKGNLIYNPDIKPKLHNTKEEYLNTLNGKNKASQFNHFYEKLLLLKDLMQTKTGKEMAKKRHEFIEIYMKQFIDEWERKI